MNILVGYTGFVGSNLYQAGEFDKVFNSSNINEAYGLKPELLVYAGMRAEKYLANNDPDRDLQLVEEAKRNIEQIDPQKLVLISTIDVYKNPKNVDEETLIETVGLHPYGYHRFLLEEWVREKYPNSHIIRLPGLFGIHLKKNFIYDYIHRVPFMLKEEKMDELVMVVAEIKEYYDLMDNGFYKCKELEADEKKHLKDLFAQTGFSALNFTDSASVFQFYPLNRLWSDIQVVIENNIQVFNPATEPIMVSELYKYLTGNEFQNETGSIPAFYDYHTKHAVLFGGKGNYIMDKEHVLKEIKEFVNKLDS